MRRKLRKIKTVKPSLLHSLTALKGLYFFWGVRLGVEWVNSPLKVIYRKTYRFLLQVNSVHVTTKLRFRETSWLSKIITGNPFCPYITISVDFGVPFERWAYVFHRFLVSIVCIESTQQHLNNFWGGCLFGGLIFWDWVVLPFDLEKKNTLRIW